MGGLLAEAKTAFGANGLYELFGVAPRCSEAELKKAYLKAARKYHPDKEQEDKAGATLRFQILSKAHAVLSSPDARQLYDRTGEVDDEAVSGNSFSDWKEYWHQLFPKVTTSKISSFQTKYQRSEEERADLRAAYLRCEGDMNAILDSIMLANAIDDEERFRTDIDAWIAAGDVPSFPAYTQEKARARKKRRDTALREAEEAAEERGARATATTKGAQQAASGNDLAAMILARREERTGMWAKFEERYAQKARKKVQRGKAAPEDLEEPSEEAFLAAQARVDARRQGGSGKADKSGKRSAAAAAAGAKPPTKRKAKKG